MTRSHRFFTPLRLWSTVAASAVIAAPLAPALHAQQGESFGTSYVATSLASPFAAPAATKPATLQAALHAPLDLSLPADNAVSSSSSSEVAEPLSAGDLDGNMQPPPRRRRYGRPNYNDRFHNSDGSNRIAVVAGGGFNEPVGDATSNYLNLGYRFEVGGGINFSKKLAVLLQFDYDHFGVPRSVTDNQTDLYDRLGFVDSNGDLLSGIGANAHIWSFTLNPTLNFYQGDKWGGYAVVGGGFYHKVTNFTLPQEAEGYDYYYGPYVYTYNQNIDTYTSNAPGVTGGVGVTYKFSRFANERFFAEARYVHTFNQFRAGDPNYDGSGTPYNLYPPNSNETSYIPITFGIRF